MPIVKEQNILENTWTFATDEDVLPSGDITVSVNHWLQEKTDLAKKAGKIGIRLAPTDSIDSIADDLAFFPIIELDFPAFTDGRSFSQAQLLRTRYNYRGEIRATGKFLADQVFYLHRVGIDSFEFSNPKDMEIGLAAMKDFSVAYQTAYRNAHE